MNQHGEPFTHLTRHKLITTIILRATAYKVVEVVSRRRGGVVESSTRDCGYSLTISDDCTRHATWSVGDLELGQTTLDREGLSVGSGREGDLGRAGGKDDGVHVVVSPVPTGGTTNVIGGVGIFSVRSRPHCERVLGDGRVLTSLECSSIVSSQDVQTLVIESVGPDFGSSRETTVDWTNV